MKVRVTEEGKQFEAYLKFAILDGNELVGMAYANNYTSCRAIHGSLYSLVNIEIIDNQGNLIKTVESSRNYKRIETIDDIIVHHTILPKSATDEFYQKALADMIRDNSEFFPERVVIAPKNELNRVAGYFIANTFGLPKQEDWVNQYVPLLSSKITTLDVITTEIAGEWENIAALKIQQMKEKEVLEIIDNAIKLGILKTKYESDFGEGIFEENMTTEDYLRANAKILAQKLDKVMKPLYDGSFIDSCVGKLKRIPVPIQARTSMAALEVLKRKKGVFVVGDMGTGKTQMSLTSVYIHHNRRLNSGATEGTRVLIVAPSNVVPKWAKLEIPKILPKGSYECRILNSTEDALQYVKEVKNGHKPPKDKIEFVLVSTDRMKLGSQGYTLGARWNSYKGVWISPNTGLPLMRPNTTQEEQKDESLCVAGWTDVVESPRIPPREEEIKKARETGNLLPNGLPKGYVKKWKTTVLNFQDDYKGKTNRSLARPARKDWFETKGKARWAIAEIFQHQLKNHFHLAIFDEIHQTKGSGTGRGLALHKIMKSARKHLYLTGTLTNGAASSIKSLLWRAFPGELLSKGITHDTSDITFSQRYGVVEKVTVIDDEVTGVHTKQKKAPRIQERPGISSELVSDFLLDKSVFVELSDLGIPLVKIDEIPRIVELDEEHLEEYRKFHVELYEKAKKHQFELGSTAWSSFTPATINYVDHPQLGGHVRFGRYDEDKKFHLIDEVEAPRFPEDYITAKERALLEDIENELKQDRRCIVYTRFTDGYQMNERLAKIIKEHGFSCEIMNSNVPTSERVDWLEKQVQKGTQVLIINQRLVEVGLDLIDFPTIMFFQLSDDINVVRQASRRAWRLGQHRNCKVFYYVADGTTQLAQFQRLMSRRVAAMIVEGRIERSDELAKYADISSKTSAVSDLTQTLSSVELTNAWSSAAKKDIDENLELLSEDVFQEKINEAFKTLTEETIRICGYQSSVEEELVAIEEPIIAEIEHIPATANDNDYIISNDDEPYETEQLDIFTYLLIKDDTSDTTHTTQTKTKKSSLVEPVHSEQLDLFAVMGL